VPPPSPSRRTPARGGRAPGERPDLIHGRLEVGGYLRQHVGDLLGAPLSSHILQEADVNRQGHHLLLGPIVEVPLQAAAFGVLGRDESAPRRLQFVGLGD
jgi:hypothetical protein